MIASRNTLFLALYRNTRQFRRQWTSRATSYGSTTSIKRHYAGKLRWFVLIGVFNLSLMSLAASAQDYERESSYCTTTCIGNYSSCVARTNGQPFQWISTLPVQRTTSAQVTEAAFGIISIFRTTGRCSSTLKLTLISGLVVSAITPRYLIWV